MAENPQSNGNSLVERSVISSGHEKTASHLLSYPKASISGGLFSSTEHGNTFAFGSASYDDSCTTNSRIGQFRVCSQQSLFHGDMSIRGDFLLAKSRGSKVDTAFNKNPARQSTISDIQVINTLAQTAICVAQVTNVCAVCLCCLIVYLKNYR